MGVVDGLAGSQAVAVAENIELGVAGGSRHLIARVDRTGADRLGSLAVKAAHGNRGNRDRERDRVAEPSIGTNTRSKGCFAKAVNIRSKSDAIIVHIRELSKAISIPAVCSRVDGHRRNIVIVSDRRTEIRSDRFICIRLQGFAGIVAVVSAVISGVKISR